MTISEGLQAAVSRGEIAGAVALVTDENETLYLEAEGLSNVAENERMSTDALFCIASMTKPITAAAVLMLQDEGKLSLDDHLEKHLPEFTQLKNAAGERVSLSLRQCLAHTSGMSDVSLEEENTAVKLADLIPMILEKPTLFNPGERWEYCQTSINMAAHVVEVISGKSFPEFLEERFFGPLGMKDTSFYPSEAQADRLARCYSRTESGEWRDDGWSWITHDRMMDRSRYPKANAGLFSTASDYALFCRMLLKKGEVEGRRYLSEEAIQEMQSVQSGDLETGFTPGNAWGVGCCLVRHPQGATEGLSPGSFGHGGLYGTQAWIDPIAGKAHVLMMQRADFDNADASDVRSEFHRSACLLD
ncbi:beta-lactamase family protein [Akkermansiaceae bacterium]|nr:beta-lactamase family protein [Akkermansiaceae bacterium]MDB4537322.1 beta-lactamase family protein [Akkermansiaceae bacterium]